MSGSTGLSPIQSYLTYSANETKYANANAAGNGQESSLIAYFQNNAAKITSPAALLGDYKALSVVLGAFNLSGSIDDTALLQQLMTQDPTSKTSTAQRIGSASYLSFANALSNWKPPPFSTASGISAIVTAYKTNQFEASVGQQTAGLQNALYFTRTAKSITSLTQLQSDRFGPAADRVRQSQLYAADRAAETEAESRRPAKAELCAAFVGNVSGAATA
jgi:hypothetical protein